MYLLDLKIRHMFYVALAKKNKIIFNEESYKKEREKERENKEVLKN